LCRGNETGQRRRAIADIDARANARPVAGSAPPDDGIHKMQTTVQSIEKARDRFSGAGSIVAMMKICR
jgi:hypothetical protein